MAQFSQGPWRKRTWHGSTIDDANGYAVAMVYQAADQQLVTAAPELLAVAQALLQEWNNGSSLAAYEAIAYAAYDAIRKATLKA